LGVGGRIILKLIFKQYDRDVNSIYLTRNHLEDQGTDGKVISKLMFKKQDEGRGLDCSGSG
jgi:hypothetical protein